MSSITCYESENLTIVGAEGEWIGSDTIHTIRLHFSILINWRIKNFYHEFGLEKQLHCVWLDDTAEVIAEKMNHEDTFLWLKEWHSWNAILETMKSIWYMVDINYRDIQNWVDKLYQQ